MKISVTFAFRLFLVLDILPVTLSCERLAQNLGSQREQAVPFAQAPVAGEGQACRDQIVSCYDTNAGHPTCPYPGQKIETGMTGSVVGCSERAICVCRCPAIAPPKTDPQ